MKAGVLYTFRVFKGLKLRTLGMLLTTASAICISSCGSIDRKMEKMEAIDPALNIDRSDYKNMGHPKSDGSQPPEMEVTIDKGAPPIPQIAEILAAPRPPKIGETQLVSIAVTDDVPLKDVLLELAKLADIDIELDAGITGGISFIAKEKPFNEVIERIANLAGLRYTMKNGVLRVERDTPFIKSYALDFLNIVRDSESSVSLSTSVQSSSSGSSGGSSGGGGSNSSSSSTKTKTEGDFWKSLEAGLDQVLSFAPAQHVSVNTLQADANLLMAATGSPVAPAAPDAVAAPAAANAPVAATSTGASKEYTINRQAGILTLNGSSKQHDLVQLLLEKLKKNSSAQVLIEAKIIEVDLNQQFKAGINWQAVGDNIGGGVSFNTIGNVLTTGTDIASLSVSKGDLTALISAVEKFGTTRTLSSPRLHAINNQPSTLTFATNRVFFKVTATQSATTTTGSVTTQPTVTVNSETNIVPIGVSMSILPAIDLENNEVTLSVHPNLTTLNGEGVEDPAVKYLAAQVNDPSLTSIIPEVQTRDLDSTVRMKSGQTMVIGGLMQQEGDNSDSGVPFVSEVPIVGNLFKGINRSSKNKELVILIKATIVDTKGSLNKVDKDIFNTFSNDPRPVTF